jgi:hypothetical protein
MQFFTWEQMLGTAIEIPCDCAFQLVSSFAELVLPSAILGFAIVFRV